MIRAQVIVISVWVAKGSLTPRDFLEIWSELIKLARGPEPSRCVEEWYLAILLQSAMADSFIAASRNDSLIANLKRVEG